MFHNHFPRFHTFHCRRPHTVGRSVFCGGTPILVGDGERGKKTLIAQYNQNKVNLGSAGLMLLGQRRPKDQYKAITPTITLTYQQQKIDGQSMVNQAERRCKHTQMTVSKSATRTSSLFSGKDHRTAHPTRGCRHPHLSLPSPTKLPPTPGTLQRHRNVSQVDSILCQIRCHVHSCEGTKRFGCSVGTLLLGQRKGDQLRGWGVWGATAILGNHGEPLGGRFRTAQAQRQLLRCLSREHP